MFFSVLISNSGICLKIFLLALAFNKVAKWHKRNGRSPIFTPNTVSTCLNIRILPININRIQLNMYFETTISKRLYPTSELMFSRISITKTLHFPSIAPYHFSKIQLFYPIYLLFEFNGTHICIELNK